MREKPQQKRRGKEKKNKRTLFRMVAPSLVIMTSPFAEDNILSIPRGPRLVRTASATALAARMLAYRTSSFLFVSTYFSVLVPGLVTCCCAPGMTALLPLPVRTSSYFLINVEMKRLKTHPHSLSTLTTPSSLGDLDLDSENKQNA